MDYIKSIMLMNSEAKERKILWILNITNTGVFMADTGVSSV